MPLYSKTAKRLEYSVQQQIANAAEQCSDVEVPRHDIASGKDLPHTLDVLPSTRVDHHTGKKTHV